jgi:hypothetical protein
MRTSRPDMEARVSRNDELMGGDFEILPFRDLPEEHRLAVAWYMGVDGEAWADILDGEADGVDGCPDIGEDREGWAAFWKARLLAAMAAIDEAYGDVPFGVTTLDTERMLDFIERDPECRVGEDGGPSYRENLRANTKGDSHPTTGRWPVILSSTDDETLQDGWHRFGAYVRAGCRDVPAVFYPEERHLVATPSPSGP